MYAFNLATGRVSMCQLCNKLAIRPEVCVLDFAGGIAPLAMPEPSKAAAAADAISEILPAYSTAAFVPNTQPVRWIDTAPDTTVQNDQPATQTADDSQAFAGDTTTSSFAPSETDLMLPAFNTMRTLLSDAIALLLGGGTGVPRLFLAPQDPGYDLDASANLNARPLNSITWGTQVADQLPNTEGTQIRVFFMPGGERISTPFGPVDTRSLSTQEQADARRAFDQFEAVIDVEFEYVSNFRDADFLIIEEYDSSPTASLGYFSIGGGNVTLRGETIATDGYGVFNDFAPGWDATGMQTGGNGFLTLLHEIGHGMGLAHPHDLGGGSTIMNGVTADFFDYGTHDLNQGIWTVMSYNDGWPDGPIGQSPSYDYGVTGTLMALDIAALQAIYGANTSYGAGATTYTLPGANTAGTHYASIWDTSGIDTITAGVSSNDAIINLNPATLRNDATGGGFVSYLNGIYGGFTIAAGVVIENATGGHGNDVLYGNAAANTLRGGDGSDQLRGHAGDDQLFGGAGADTFAFVSDGGSDVVHDFENDIDTLGFSEALLNAGALSPLDRAVQQGDDVFFDFGAGTTMLVLNSLLADLSNDIGSF